MTAAEKIAEARALIEPLTGHTPGAWEIDAPKDESVEIGAGSFSIAGLYEAAPDALPDARLIAAAPALRDTVAALADLADAQAQRIKTLEAALRLARECEGRFLPTDPPQDAWKARRVDDVIAAALGDAP